MDVSERNTLRELPSIDALLHADGVSELVEFYGRDLVVEGSRAVLDEWRSRLVSSQLNAPITAEIVDELLQWLTAVLSPTLKPVINGTGVIIHTNLGRSPIDPRAMEWAKEISSGYSSLEYDLDSGTRGKRSIHAERLLERLTGAQNALVVNNNAAAVLLMLSALCRDKEVIISRSQLIEIGGGFRIPDVLKQSGAVLREVGTTNKTHLRDYEDAINESTGAILVAHQSNFKIVGFSSTPSLEDLSSIAAASNLPLLYDQGSGALRDLSSFGLDRELTVREALLSGVDLVAFSGDKLLGGPQAGILCGSESLLAAIRRHPLARAVRADKMSLAVLSRTLMSYITGRENLEIPIWRMISRSLDSIERSANAWAAQLKERGITAAVQSGHSTVGGGSLPGSLLPTMLLSIAVENPDILAHSLRISDPPVIGRISGDLLLFDPRTILPEQEQIFLQTIVKYAAI